MVFSDTVFLFLFFPMLLLVYFNPWGKSITYKNIVLVVFSILFYAWGEPVFVFLMLFSIWLTWKTGGWIEKTHNRKALYFIIAYHIGLLFIFKYLSFLCGQFGLLLHKENCDISITLPIGISFFTFQLMSYIFDIWYGRAKAQSLLNVTLYIACFPQLIAGPIVRYESISAEIMDRRSTWENVSGGMRRFTYGLAKKVLIANYVAQIADNSFDYLFVNGNLSVMGAWLGAICYTLQIYFDFSGYSDMAIGLAEIFGFHYAENFNYPYIARSITEFWRRWHISLSTWFRDYVYIPLGGNRVRKSRWVFNLFIVWLLTGIWHGANWTFVVWGMIYFIVLLCEKQFPFVKKMPRIISSAYVMLIVAVNWVIFRSESLAGAVRYLKIMAGGGTALYDNNFLSALKNAGVVIVIAILLSTPVYKKFVMKLKGRNLAGVEDILCFVIYLIALTQTAAASYNPFIYFNF